MMSFLHDGRHNETNNETFYTGHMRYDYFHIIFEANNILRIHEHHEMKREPSSLLGIQRFNWKSNYVWLMNDFLACFA